MQITDSANFYVGLNFLGKRVEAQLSKRRDRHIFLVPLTPPSQKLKDGMKNLTFKQLRALRMVARTGQVTTAAEALDVTPPAITLQLRLLEEQAGLPLLERGKQGFRLTEAGQKLNDMAQKIEELVRECEESLAYLRGIDSGRIAIGVISTAKYFVPQAVAAFLRAHPQVQLTFSVGNRDETMEGLTAPTLDFAIMGRPPKEVQVVSEVIGEHPHVFIAPPDHALTKQSRIPLSRLTKETILLREQGSGTRQLLQQFVSEQGVDWRGGMEIGSNESIKQGVMAGLGIAFISAHTIAAELEQKRLAILDVVGMPLVRQWHVVRLNEKRLLPATQALWDFLATSGYQFLPEVPVFAEE
jgi:LysR family transcriptional regulator for metE and metH